MTIQNLQKFVDALWDWGFLNDCFGSTGIRATDMDAAFERNGHFLAIEAKGPKVQFKNGQIRYFRALAKKGWTILLVWGEPNKPERMAIWHPGAAWATEPEPATIKDIKNVVAEWFKRANGSAA